MTASFFHNKVLLAVLLAAAFTSHAAGSNLPDTVKGFQQQSLEVCLDRADQERSVTDWQRIAQFGAESAISQWEKTAAQLYADAMDVDQARGQLSGWVGTQIQDRYESWLLRRFFSQNGSLGAGAVRQAIADANLQYLYTTDSSGAVQFDSNGDPILKGADGVQADRDAWRARISEAEDAAMAAWGQRVDQAFAPELAGLLSGDSLAKYQDYKVGFQAGVRREMERVALQGEISLVSRRLYDQYSLRKKSESATADAVADQIVRDTKAQTDEGIQQIQAGLSMTPEAVDSSTPTIDIEKWQASFRAAFDAGLSRWDEAEQKFLASRMEWEQDAGKSYTEGEQAWAAAYQRLQTERKAWEKQVDTLLQAGSARWEQQRADLSAAIESARTEFQKERDERVAAMQDQVGALVDMYAQTQQVLATAQASGQALINRIGITDKTIGAYVPFGESAVAAIEQSRKDTWNGYISDLGTRINSLSAQAAGLSGRIASLQDDLSRYSGIFAASGTTTYTATTITNTTVRTLSMDTTTTITITTTTTWDANSNKITHTNTTSTRNSSTNQTSTTTWSSTEFLNYGTAIKQYIQDSIELSQAQKSRRDVIDQLTPLQSLANTMTRATADAGTFLQGERAAFVSARSQYQDYLRRQSPFDADVLAAEWERYGRLKDWLDVITRYNGQANDTKQKLQEALGTAFGTEAIDLRDVLKINGDTGVSYLDEFQLELLRAKAVQSYWTQKKAIADAVVAYAQDLSSGRQTEDQSEKAYQAAQDAYNSQLAACNQVMAQLQAGGADLAAARQALETAQATADEASAHYQESYDKYLQALVATQSGNVEFYQDQIKQKYSDLLAASGMSGSDVELADASTQYFAAARHYGYDLAVQEAWGSVSELIHGDPQSGVPSLESLKSEAGAIQVPGSVDSIPSTVQQLGVAIDSPHFTQVSDLYSAWHGEVPREAKDLAGWKLVGYLKVLKAKAQAACDERLAEIRAHGAVDSDSLYSESGGQRAGGSLASRLSADSAAGQLELIAARAAAEKSGLQAWLQLQSGQTPASGDALLLAHAAPSGLSQEEAQARIQALQAVQNALHGADTDPAGAAARLRDRVQAGGWIRGFVAGQGTFVDETAGDLVLGLCMPQYQEAARADGLASAWKTASWDSTALLAERETSAIGAVKQVFNSHGFSLADGSVLPTSESVAARLGSQTAAEAVGYAAALGVELGQAASDGPQWLQDRIRDYTYSLASYAVAVAVKGGAVSQASTLAAAATSAAASAKAARTDLQSLSTQLSGTGRLAALVDLSTRSDPPSASAAAAQNVIVESAAIQVARRSLADTGETLEQIAAELVPGMPVALSGQIFLRATQLLQTNSGSDVIAQRIAAYQQWSTVSVNDAVQTMVVSTLASQAKALWEAIDAAGPDNLSTAINGYLHGYDPGQAPQEILDLCQGLLDGVVSRDELFRTFLFGQNFDSLMMSFDAMGAAGDVYKRAAAVRIASLQDGSADGQALAAFLWGRTGVAHSEEAQALTGKSASLDLTREALAGGSELSLEYLCKRLLLQGLPIDGDLADRLAAASPSVRDEVSSFASTLHAARGYIPVLDGNAGAYVVGLGGDLSAQSALAAALSTGQWDDEIFAASAQGSYLDWRQGVIDASLDSAVPAIQNELSQTASVFARTSFQRSTEAGYWKQVQDEADTPASWRTYLSSSNLGEATVASTATAQTRDACSYTMATYMEENGLLDAFNGLVRQEKAFAQQLGASAGDPTAVTKFHDFLAQLVAGTAAETDVPQITEQGLQAAQNRYQAAVSRIQGLQEDIRRSGAALALVDLSTDARQQELDQAVTVMTGLTAQVNVTQAAADRALTDFETIGNQYNGLYAQLQASEASLTDARFSLRVQQEIRDWASNGYLSTSGEAVQGYQSPVQNQQDAEQHLLKATAALDALNGLFGNSTVSERPIGDAATLAAYDAWKTSYAEMMRLEQASGELNAATAAQQTRVEDLTTNLDQARNDILDGSLAAYNLQSLGKSSTNSWASYLVVQDGKLKLNMDGGYHLVAQVDQIAVDSVTNFFQTKEDGSEATAFERQMSEFVSYLAALTPGQETALIDRWGFAADWLKRRLYDGGSADVRNMVGSPYASDAGMVDQKWLDFRAAGEHTTEVGNQWARAAYAYAGQQYTMVMGNADEKAAFEFYLAMRAATGREGSDLSQFHTRTYSVIMNTLYAFLDQRYGHYKRRASDHGWLNVAMGSAQDRDAYNDLRIECANTIGQFRNGSDSRALQTATSFFTSTKNELDAAKARLAELQGTNNTRLASVGDFVAQYRKLKGERLHVSADSVVVDPALSVQFSTAWESLKTEDKVSFSNALRKMTQIAEARNTDMDVEVKAALAKARSELAQAQQEYLSTYSAFLEGQADENALKDSAAKAYQNSAWVARTEQELTSGVLSQAAFTNGPLTDVELEARLAAVQKYAQSVVVAYAGSLDARGTEAEQQWSQSMTDLGDQRQSWYAQVGLVFAKAASAWDSSQQKLTQSISTWRQGFQQQYTDKSEAWRLSYLNFGQQKLEWVQQIETKAATAGNEAILSEVGASADDAMRSASSPLIASMSFDPQEANLQVEGLLSQEGSAQALTAIRRMNSGIASSQVMAASAGLRVDTRGARIAAEVKRFLADSRAEMSALAAREIADQAQDSVVQARKALAESVKKANEGFSESMDYTFANSQEREGSPNTE